MLSLKNVKVLYDDVLLVVKGISLSVSEGAIVALLGANGAGKSTTAKAICGLLDSQDGEVSEGIIEFLGKEITNRPAELVVKKGISMVPEGRMVFAQLTAEENLKVGGYLRRNDRLLKEDTDQVWSLFPLLWERRKAKAGYLSGGEQQMLAIGRALMARPKLLILDEPSLGLAPKFTEEVFQVVKRINSENKTAILLIEQNAQAAFSVSSYGYIMENGRIVMDAPTERLLKDADIREFYLGIASDSTQQKKYSEVKSYKRRKRWLS